MTLLAVLAGADDRAAVERSLERAERQWDATAAVAVLSRARALRHTEAAAETALLQAHAGLLVAELLRVRFEELGDAASPEREALGQRIDVAAGEALELLPALRETSERWRLEADLVATMIRSDFRAKRYEARLRAAIAKARQLDPRNPRALVAAAKPLIFAPPDRGRDLQAGIALLDEALALDPRLEPALLLRAHAHEELGERALAEADWRAALARNPECRPARAALTAPAPSH